MRLESNFFRLHQFIFPFFAWQWYNTRMTKQRMIVTDDQLLIDMDLLFNAIREADGDWQKVEQDMKAYLGAVQSMAGEATDES